MAGSPIKLTEFQILVFREIEGHSQCLIKSGSLPDDLHRMGKEYTMPQSSHSQAAELHNLASHAHAAAAVAHGKADHRTAHELSNQAHELSREALKHSEQLDTEAAGSTKAATGTSKKVEAVHVIRPGLPL